MKKIALFALMSVLSGAAVSGTIAPSGTGTTENIDSTDCEMVASASSFDFKTSANVGVSYTCSTTAAAVQAGSTKGKFVYGGSTAGGGVKSCGTDVSTSNGYSSTPSSAEGDGCS